MYSRNPRLTRAALCARRYFHCSSAASAENSVTPNTAGSSAVMDSLLYGSIGQRSGFRFEVWLYHRGTIYNPSKEFPLGGGFGWGRPTCPCAAGWFGRRREPIVCPTSGVAATYDTVNPEELAGGSMIQDRGVNVAAITPRGQQGDVDFGAVFELIDYL